MRFLFLLFLQTFVLNIWAQTYDVDFNPYTIPNNEPGKYFAKVWQTNELEDTVYFQDVLLLDSNQHILKEIGKYEISTNWITILPERDSVIITPPKIDTIIETWSVQFDSTEKVIVIKNKHTEECKITDIKRQFLGLQEDINYPYFKDNDSSSITELHDGLSSELLWIPNINSQECLKGDNGVVWYRTELPVEFVRLTWKLSKKNGIGKVEVEVEEINRPTYQVNQNFEIKYIKLPPIKKEVVIIQPRKRLKKEVLQKVKFSTVTGKKIVHQEKWSDWTEVLCPFHVGTTYTILMIQQALNEKGYLVEENNILDQATKKALTDFMRDNGIPVCGTNEPLLKALLGEDYRN